MFADDVDLGDIIFPESEIEEKKFELNEIIEGKIVRVDDDYVVIDVGFKSEGSIPRSEWEPHEEQPEVGQTLQVLIEDLEDESGRADDPHGLIAVSKKKADHIIHWKNVISTVKENDIVTGTCTRKIKGGLLVDIWCSSFLAREPSRHSPSGRYWRIYWACCPVRSIED